MTPHAKRSLLRWCFLTTEREEYARRYGDFPGTIGSTGMITQSVISA